MTKYLEKMKADLLNTYKEELCEDSVEAIKNAETLPQFIGLLHKFSAYFNYKELPKIEWVRKWFNTPELKQIANENGVYVDDIVSIVNPSTPIVLMGDSKAMLVCTTQHFYQVITQDKSELSISTLGSCIVRVRKKNNSKVSTLHKHNFSRIKIITI